MITRWPLSNANEWLLAEGLRLSYLEPKPMREKCGFIPDLKDDLSDMQTVLRSCFLPELAFY